jgi:hypothetical protein
MREELVTRNVARLVEVPRFQRTEIKPWTTTEVTRFLDKARDHKWYPAFLLVALYGLRRGEAIGLRWSDVDFAHNELHIRQQVFRAGGVVQQGPVKTQAGQRDLPLLLAVAEELESYREAQEKVGVGGGRPPLSPAYCMEPMTASASTRYAAHMMTDMPYDDMDDTQFEEFCFALMGELGFVNLDWRKGTGLSASPSDSGRDIVAQLPARSWTVANIWKLGSWIASTTSAAFRRTRLLGCFLGQRLSGQTSRS